MFDKVIVFVIQQIAKKYLEIMFEICIDGTATFRENMT